MRFYLLFVLSFLLTTVKHAQEQRQLLTASGTEVTASIGQLMVPENRDKPASTPIIVGYVRLHGRGTQPPIFFLEGGPGSTDNWRTKSPDELERWLPLLEDRDVIFIDQRGTGPSAQRLTYITREPVPHDVLVTAEKARAHYRKMLPKALAAWEEAGVDYAGYHVRASAADIEDLRKEFGLDRIVLFGFSYGTHLAQTYLKYYGKRVDRAILVGVEGLNQTFKEPLRMDAQLHRLASMVAADPETSSHIPDLVDLYERVGKKLAAKPLSFTLQNPLTGSDMPLLVGKFGLDLLLRFDLGDASDLPDIPGILYELDNGVTNGLEFYLKKRYTSLFGLAAMPLATDLASGASQDHWMHIESEAPQSCFEDVMNFPLANLRDLWPVSDLGDEFRRPFSSDVPTLLLSGSLDMNTPPAQAEELAWWFPRSTHLTVENAGHEQIMTHPGAGRAIQAFLRGDTTPETRLTWPALKFAPINLK